jgi:hypothetical protein
MDESEYKRMDGLSEEPWRGPHNRREIEMLRAGTKPLAMLDDYHLEHQGTTIEELLAEGFLVESDTLPDKVSRHLIARRGEEWRIPVVRSVYWDVEARRLAGIEPMMHDHHHIVLGTVLGYRMDDVARWVNDDPVKTMNTKWRCAA